jgi:serine/threonine protein phosphatase 1
MPSNKTYIIGDIHGCAKTFRKMVEEVIQLKKEDSLYLLGDYIDRGPNSKGVIDFILELRDAGMQVFTLRGNHEQLMIEAVNSPAVERMWLQNGGDKTLKSFGASTVREIPVAYIKFCLDTSFYFETDDFLLVHAGLNCSAEDPLQDKMSMMWTRDFNDEKKYLQGKILIHGHTPITSDVLLAQKFESPLNLDGGCVYRGFSGKGNLYALDFYTQSFKEVRNID